MSNLYKHNITGKLIIADTTPVGYSLVDLSAIGNTSDTISPFYRGLLVHTQTVWHPVNYYGGSPETEVSGSNGYSNGIAAAYKQSLTPPTDNPGDTTYDFTTASITTNLANGWVKDIPSGPDPVYARFNPVTSQATSVSFLAADWGPVTLLHTSGVDGDSSFPSYVFIRSDTLPATPTGGSYASPLPITAGYSDGIPADNGKPVWMSKRVFSLSGTGLQDLVWSTPAKIGTPSTSSKLQFSVDGTTSWHDTPAVGDKYMRTGVSTDNGYTWSYSGVVRIKGETGASGTATRGPAHFYTAGSFWSDTTASTLVTSSGYTPMEGDQVTISSSGFSHTKKWTSGSWQDMGTVFNGDLFVDGSISAAKVNSNGIEVRDFYGNVLFSVGVPLDFSRIGGTTRPDDNATVGASSSNLKVGIGANIIPNSDFSSGIQNWYTGSIAGGGANFDGPVWDLGGTANIPSGGHAIGMVRTGNTLAAAGGADIYFKPLSVTAGAFYEATCFLASHRCDMEMVIEWLTSTDTHVSFTSVGSNSSNRLTGGVDIRDWHRVELLVSAPGTATKAKIILRGSAVDSGFSDPYFWGTKPMLAPALPGQTEFSPWRSGESSGAFAEVDTLHPGNIGVYMPLATIGTAQIVDASVETLKVAGNAITENVYHSTIYVNLTLPVSTNFSYQATVLRTAASLTVPVLTKDSWRVVLVSIQFRSYEAQPGDGFYGLEVGGGGEYVDFQSPKLRYGSFVGETFTTSFLVFVPALQTNLGKDLVVYLTNGNSSTTKWTVTPTAKAKITIMTSKDIL